MSQTGYTDSYIEFCASNGQIITTYTIKGTFTLSNQEAHGFTCKN